MKVECKNSDGEVIWSYDCKTQEGVTSTEYLKDGTQEQIITALVNATDQARGQARSSESVN